MEMSVQCFESINGGAVSVALQLVLLVSSSQLARLGVAAEKFDAGDVRCGIGEVCKRPFGMRTTGRCVAVARSVSSTTLKR